MSGFRQQGNVHSRVPVPADFGVTSKIPVLVMIFDAVSDQEFLILPALQLQHRFLVAPVPHCFSGFPLETAEAKSGEFYGPLGKGGATGSHDSGEYKGPVGVLKKERPACRSASLVVPGIALECVRTADETRAMPSLSEETS